MKLLLIVNLLVSFKLIAAIEFHEPILLARSNVRDSYNLPKLSFISNAAPVINNKGEVAFKVVATGEEGNQGLWVKGAEDTAGKIQYVVSDDLVITDPSINDSGMIAFSLFDEAKSEGLFTFDIHSLKENHVLKSDKLDLDFFTYPTINANNDIYFRGTNKNNDRAFYLFNSNLVKLVSEGLEVAGNTASYLFRPSVNQNNLMAFKMRVGKKGSWDEKNPDMIVLYNPKVLNEQNEPSVKYIAVDHDYDSGSHFLSFLNSVSLSNAGHVGFSAITDDGRIGVFIYNLGEIKKVAIENEEDILNVETFSVKVNSNGHLLFRGKDREGKRALFFFNGEKVVKLIYEGSEIASDLGLAKILDNPNFPGISGEVDLNDADQIVFGAVIQSAKDSHEWGEGIYQINPKI